MMSSKLVSRAIAISLAFVAVAASADSPHFVRQPTATLDAEGNYTVSFKEVGLGNQFITYSLTATNATFTFQCFNPAGNKPQGAPNGQSFSDKSTFTTLEPHNGQITGSITMSPEKGDASCQGNAMKLCLIAVSYSGVQFTEETTPIGPIAMPDKSLTLAKPDCSY
jgi:hypothetical protein